MNQEVIDMVNGIERATVGYVLRIIDRGDKLAAMGFESMPHMTDNQKAELRALRDELQSARKPAKRARARKSSRRPNGEKAE